jgi:hypothetical protein
MRYTSKLALASLATVALMSFGTASPSYATYTCKHSCGFEYVSYSCYPEILYCAPVAKKSATPAPHNGHGGGGGSGGGGGGSTTAKDLPYERLQNNGFVRQTTTGSGTGDTQQAAIALATTNCHTKSAALPHPQVQNLNCKSAQCPDGKHAGGKNGPSVANLHDIDFSQNDCHEDGAKSTGGGDPQGFAEDNSTGGIVEDSLERVLDNY